MKYLRTKDGIFIGNKNKVGAWEINAPYKIFDRDIVAKANTMEELCDGFWWENTAYSDPIFIPNFGLVLDRIRAWKESDQELDTHGFDKITIYGSIYIKGKGWVHSCKVNKESEKCELL